MFSFFKKKSPTLLLDPTLASSVAPDPVTAENNSTASSNTKATDPSPIDVVNPLLPDEMPYQSYLWITDEGLLRDEGILFGLSGGKIEEKVEAIKHYYAAQVIQAEREIEFLDQEISEATSTLAGSFQEEGVIKSRIKEVGDFLPVDVKNGFWDVLSFLGFCAVIGCNYFLIYQTGSKAWEYPVAVSTGAYLFGLLSMFNKASMLFSSEANTAAETNQVERWKLLGQEIVVPLVVTIYVTVSGWVYHRPEFAVASGLIIFFLFLYAGKALFRQVGFLRTVFNHFVNARKARKWKKEQIVKLEKEREVLREKQEIFLGKIKEFREKQQLVRLPTQIEKDRDTRIKLFESEYKLAMESRKVVSLDKLDKITSLN